MNAPKRPMPPRPSALNRAPSFAPGARPSQRPLAPIVQPIPTTKASPSFAPKPLPTGTSALHSISDYEAAALVDDLGGPTVTAFDAPDDLAAFGHTEPTELDDIPILNEVDPDDDQATVLAPSPMQPQFDDLHTKLSPAEPFAPTEPALRPVSIPPPRPSFAPPRQSEPPPRPSFAPPPRAIPAPRPTDAMQGRPRTRSIPPARPSAPPPRPSTAPANPFLSSAPPPPPAGAMFDDVDTAFVGGKNMAPDFAALERRASRPDFDIPDPVAEPPAMRPRMQSLDFGGGVVVETLEEFEPNRSHQEVSDAWRPDLAPPPARAEHANVMRLESIQPPAFDPRSAPTAPIHAARPPMPTLDLQAEAQRAAGVGKVRVAYVIAGISILLLIAAILSAIFVW